MGVESDAVIIYLKSEVPFSRVQRNEHLRSTAVLANVVEGLLKQPKDYDSERRWYVFLVNV